MAPIAHKIVPFDFRNEVEVTLKPGECIDAYNAKLSYSMGDIESKKKSGSLKQMISRTVADEEMLLRKYIATASGRGGTLRLFHDKGERAAGPSQGSFCTHSIVTIELPSQSSLLLDEDDYLMMSEEGPELNNDFKFKALFSTADFLKPRLDNDTSVAKSVWLSLPEFEVLDVPAKETLTIHPDELLVALLSRKDAYKITAKAGLMAINRVMVLVEGPAKVYRKLPQLSPMEKKNPALFLYGIPPVICNCGGTHGGAAVRKPVSRRRQSSKRK